MSQRSEVPVGIVGAGIHSEQREVPESTPPAAAKRAAFQPGWQGSAPRVDGIEK